MRCTITAIITLLACAAFATPMAPTPIATVGKTSTPPAIDGKLDDPCWGPGGSASLTNFVEPNLSGFAPVATQARVCYDDEAFYVAVRCEEPRMNQLVRFHTDHDGSIWRDDCVEVFIDANHDRTTFHQFVINANGALYDSHPALGAAWNSEAVSAGAVGEDFWAVEIAIPLKDIGGDASPGSIWGFNVGRERHAVDGQLSIWSPTYGKFLEPDRFGEILFALAPIPVAVQHSAAGFGFNHVAVNGPARPSASLLRDWPNELGRSWETPEPVVTGQAGNWTVSYRVVDGSERALIVTTPGDVAPSYRQAFPIGITPAPRTAALAKALLGLEKRADGEGQFAGDIRGVVSQARDALMGFIQTNLARDQLLSHSDWVKIAAAHGSLYNRVAGLVYVIWSKSPLDGLERNEMPPGIHASGRLELDAFVNEREAATAIITNLSEQVLEGRVTTTALRLLPGPAGEGNGPDLAVNGDFALDRDSDGTPDGWEAAHTGTKSFIETQPDGSEALCISGASGRASTGNLRQTVKLSPEKTYTLVAEVSSENIPTNAGFIHVINSGWTWSATRSVGGRTSARERQVMTFTPPESPLHQIVLRLDTPAGGTVRYHRISLYEGGITETTFSRRHIRLHEVAHQDLQVGKTVADPLPVIGQGQVLTVPAGGSRQVWISLSTTGLPPGEYTSSVVFTPFDREVPRKSMPMRITVRPVRLPDRMPVATFNWDYAHNEQYVQDLAAHRTNSYLVSTACRANFDKDGNLTGPVDWSSHDEMLQVKLRYARENGGIVLFSYGIVRDFDTRYRSRHGWEYMGEEWKRAFRTWVLEFERHHRDDIGMGYAEYAVQLWDEATGKNAELTVQAGEFLRTFAPRVRTCMDGAQNVAEIKAMDPVIDLWIPHQTTLYRHAEADEIRALYAELMKRGEPVWTYTCSTNMKALHPLDYYRLKEWRAWDLGVQGSCYWAYNSWRGDPWNDFDGEIADCGSIYDGTEEPVTSRRWEATLDGREDYLCLHMLAQEGKRLGGEHKQQIDTLIAESVAKVLGAPRDIELFSRTRDALADAVERYCGANPPEILQGPDFVTAGNQVTVSWRTDRPASGELYYRIAGDAHWRLADFPLERRHVLGLSDLAPQRAYEWYLIYWSETGAAATELAGMRPDKRFRTHETIDE